MGGLPRRVTTKKALREKQTDDSTTFSSLRTIELSKKFNIGIIQIVVEFMQDGVHDPLGDVTRTVSSVKRARERQRWIEHT